MPTIAWSSTDGAYFGYVTFDDADIALPPFVDPAHLPPDFQNGDIITGAQLNEAIGFGVEVTYDDSALGDPDDDSFGDDGMGGTGDDGGPGDEDSGP